MSKNMTYSRTGKMKEILVPKKLSRRADRVGRKTSRTKHESQPQMLLRV